MHILHVITGDLWAGAEAQLFYTVQELNKEHQADVHVILFNKGELYERLLKMNIDVTVLDEGDLSSIALCKGIVQKIIQCDVNVAHVHDYKSHILTALAKLLSGKKRCILFRTIHGLAIPGSLRSYFVLGCEQFFLRYMTDHLIAVSNELMQLFSKKQTKAIVHQINNAVAANSFPATTDVTTVRSLFGLKEKQFWIGTAARLELVKNLNMLIDAAKYLRDKYPELCFRVSIFGDGSLRESLETQITQHGLTSFVFLEGHNSDLMPVLQALDVFTLTSKHEGLPMSLLEAMSFGTIPVCTAVGGMKEVISNGKDGFLVSPADAGELADTLALICKKGQDLNPVRVKAQEKVAKSFSIEQNSKKLFSLYEDHLQMGMAN